MRIMQSPGAKAQHLTSSLCDCSERPLQCFFRGRDLLFHNVITITGLCLGWSVCAQRKSLQQSLKLSDAVINQNSHCPSTFGVMGKGIHNDSFSTSIDCRLIYRNCWMLNVTRCSSKGHSNAQELKSRKSTLRLGKILRLYVNVPQCWMCRLLASM